MDYGVGGWLPGAARSGFASVGGCVGWGVCRFGGVVWWAAGVVSGGGGGLLWRAW